MAPTIELKFGDGTRQIPAAPYYVLSNDKFMSGWGPATNKVNTVVLPCRSYPEALAVQRYCKERPEQTRVRIVVHKPTLRRGILYSVVLDREDYSAWYCYCPIVTGQESEA